MKKVLLVSILLSAIVVVAVAGNAGGPGGKAGQQVQKQAQEQAQVQDRPQEQSQQQNIDKVQSQSKAQLNASGDRIREEERLRNQTRALRGAQLHKQIQDRKQEQDRLHATLPPEQQRVHSRYSNVSAFVHTLLDEGQAREMLGGIGPQVSAFAREFNNSLQAQVRAEERIETRNMFVRFLAGGDEEAARLLAQEAVRNQERIQQARELIAQCEDCDPEVREILQEQFREMEQQQARIQQLAQRERQDKGIFGWLWK
ncbi:MAG: hypothetical protein QFX32_03790 [Methanolinea sp.]|nr:hypothetical protein [Methanolinea sp.]